MDENMQLFKKKISDFNIKYHENECQVHNKYYHQHPECFGLHGDYWSDYQIINTCNNMCEECVKEYVEITSIYWKLCVLDNLQKSVE